MNPAPGLGSALLILFNLVYFVFMMLITSLFIESVWIGKSRWLIVPIVGLSLVVFAIYPGLLIRILEAVTGPPAPGAFLEVTAFGILAGMAASSL